MSHIQNCNGLQDLNECSRFERDYTRKVSQRLFDSLYIKSNVDVNIIGSNAYMLSGELMTLLIGRNVKINIVSLQFSEYHNSGGFY